jgi:hypothetical protein
MAVPPVASSAAAAAIAAQKFQFLRIMATSPLRALSGEHMAHAQIDKELA